LKIEEDNPSGDLQAFLWILAIFEWFGNQTVTISGIPERLFSSLPGIIESYT
jgi:hypothetical protein